MLGNRKAGRPRRTAIEMVRSRAWFEAVSFYSGKAAAALEAEFCSARGKPSCLWSKYGRGETGPKEPLVLRVDEAYKNTGYWYFHPLWELAAERVLPPEVLHRLICRLEPRVRTYLLRDGSEMHPLFWYAADFDPIVVINVFIDLRTLGSLAGIVAMIRIAELLQNQSLHLAGYIALALHARHARDKQILRSLEPDFHALMMRRLFQIQYSDKNAARILDAINSAAQSKGASRDPEFIALVATRCLANTKDISWLWAAGHVGLEAFSSLVC